eukprot:SM000057S18445  [mRNA]  locus=s57:722808:725846:- [translate_table: standard]
MHRDAPAAAPAGRQPKDKARAAAAAAARPWRLEDDLGQSKFVGTLEGGQRSNYFLLIMQGKDFAALPAGDWYNFHKVIQYKTLTLEEAEERMKDRRKTVDGYQRWMMKAAGSAAAAGADDEALAGGKARKKDEEDDLLKDGADSDVGETAEDEDEEEARKDRLGLKAGAKGGGDEEEEGAPREEADGDDDEKDKGDDWEHEETFTDDDEAAGNDAEEREDPDRGPEMPPPAIKEQEDKGEDEEMDQAAGGLSTSGREIKKLLKQEDAEDEDVEDEEEEEDDDVDMDKEDVMLSSILFKPKKEPSPARSEMVDVKTGPSNGRLTPPPANAATAPAVKRKVSPEEAKAIAAAKRVKSEAVLREQGVRPQGSTVTLAKAPPAAGKGPPGGKGQSMSGAGEGITEEAVRVVLRAGMIKSQDLVTKFRGRLRTPEDKAAFSAILQKIAKILKTPEGNFMVLR